jgi:hypothetical protein
MFPGSKRQVFRMELHTRDNSRVPDAGSLRKGAIDNAVAQRQTF